MSECFPASSPWQHPGILVSETQLAFIKQQIVSHAEPWHQQFVAAKASPYGNKDYKPKGPPTDGIIQCGPLSQPDGGCSNASEDSTAAYIQALLWYITDDSVYANNAIAILNDYAYHLKGYAGTNHIPCPGEPSTCSNARLQAARDSEKWPRAAEIIRHANAGKAGWADNDIEAFSRMLTEIYEPALYDGNDGNGSAELSMIDGMMGIAVFNEDLPLLRHAQTLWQLRIPAYFYNESLDNPLYPGTHAPFPPGKSGTWNGQLVFNSQTTGVTQETCRTLGEAESGLAAAIHAAETDRIQGGELSASLYTANGAQQRLVTSLNLMAGLEAAQSTSAPEDFCTGAGGRITLGTGLPNVIGYNEYHNRLHDPRMADASGSLGLHGTANTYWSIQKSLLSNASGYSPNLQMSVFETLTHY